MHRVLILSAGYGEGHNAAARALAAALAEAGHAVQVRDLFLDTYGKTQELSRGLYLNCIEHAPWLWAIAYHALDRLPIMRHVISPCLRAMQKRLGEMLESWRPDSVVSVYPGYSYLLDRLFPAGAKFPRHTLVTDSITINSIWHRGGSDTWMVPNEDTAAAMRAAGVAGSRIQVTGFPVPLIFADDRPDRRPPGGQEPLRILYMANCNRRHAAQIVRGLLAMPQVRLTVSAGKDERLARRLEAIAAEMQRPMELHGWTDRIPQLLMANHVVIGKAGGAATQEALAACTPMLITKIVPGQELGNALLVERHGCGAITPSAAAVHRQVETLLENDCALWKQWHEAIQRISRPDAARDAARFVLNFRAPAVHA